MKKLNVIIGLFVIIVALLVFGIFDGKKDEIVFFCGVGGNDANYPFYVDEDYIYYYHDTGYYIKYNGKRTMIDDALKRGIITIEDIDKAAKEDPKCQYNKIPHAEW